jgi:hypothetical protein
MTHRYRPPSPRRYVDPMRVSTGMIYQPSLDVPQQISGRTSADAVHRGGASRAPEAQLISSTTYRGDPHHGGAPISKHEYKVPIRQRRNTLDPDSARLEPSRGPLSVVVPTSPNHTRPIVSSSDRPRSPIGRTYRDGGGYLVPAASPRHHRRIFSADGENAPALLPQDRERRPRTDRQYRDAGADRQRTYPMSQQVAIRPKDYDYEENYSYTTPREEFDRDSAAKSAARLRPRRESYDRRERPTSIVGLEGYVPPRSTRDPGPPVASRGLDRMKYDRPARADDDMDLGRRYSVRDPPAREKDELYDPPKRRMSQRAPVSLHQDRDREEGYTSYREDYDDKRDRQRRPRYDDDPKDFGKYDREPPRREHSPPRREHRHRRDEEVSGPGLGTAAGLAGAGLAAAGIASARSKHRDRDSDEEEVIRRERKDKDRERDRRARDIDPRDDDRADDRKPRDRRLDILSEDEPKSRERRDRTGKDHDSSDGSDRDRHKHRRHRRDRDDEKDKEDDDSSSTSSGSRQIDPLTRDPEGEERNRRHEEKRRRRRDREERDRHGFIADNETPIVQEPPRDKESLEPQRPRQVELVPPAPKEPEAPVRGILKQPKEKFPEDPNAIREGVAPLKDAGKKGVPPGARWTKIDRRLVNPAALEDAHERFEERADYVIVLRVLTKEEIQGFAVKTQEIRGK